VLAVDVSFSPLSEMFKVFAFVSATLDEAAKN
jgi:hypothetical protein